MVKCVPWWLTGIEPVHGSHAATCIENREKPQIRVAFACSLTSLFSVAYCGYELMLYPSEQPTTQEMDDYYYKRYKPDARNCARKKFTAMVLPMKAINQELRFFKEIGASVQTIAM